MVDAKPVQLKPAAGPEFVARIKLGVGKLRQSQFARDALLLLILNAASRAINFLGSAYAARCLGPVNLGVSAVIQTTARQVALIFDGGFSVVGVRKVAAQKDQCPRITEAIAAFQVTLALAAALVWSVVAFVAIEKSRRAAWLLGIPLMVFYATNFTYAFQGLEKLPVQNAISAGGALLGALGYFLFFHPAMPLGADLVVLAVAGTITAVVVWGAYYRLFRRLPIGRPRWAYLRSLLGESWRYWLLAVLVYFYSLFQIPLIALFLGDAKAGIFRSAFLLAAGLELLFNSINNLLLARLVAWKKVGLQLMWHRQFRLLAIFLSIGLPLVLGLIVTAPAIYHLILGPAFTEGIPVFRILVVGRLVVFLGQTFVWGLVACEQDNSFLLVTLLGAALSLTLNFVAIPTFGIQGSAVVSVLAEMTIAIGCFLRLRRFVRTRLPLEGCASV